MASSRIEPAYSIVPQPTTLPRTPVLHSNLDTCGMRKQGDGGTDGQEGKGRTQTYLLCTASVRILLATDVLV
jgi:hypothetical protein